MLFRNPFQTKSATSFAMHVYCFLADRLSICSCIPTKAQAIDGQHSLWIVKPAKSILSTKSLTNHHDYQLRDSIIPKNTQARACLLHRLPKDIQMNRHCTT